MTKLFWDGHRSDEVAMVNAYIPVMGECDSEFTELENFRVFQNAYQRFYNDGAIPNYHKMKRLAKSVNVEYNTADREASLEEIAAALLDLALDVVLAGIAEKPVSPLSKGRS